MLKIVNGGGNLLFVYLQHQQLVKQASSSPLGEAFLII